MNIEKIIYEKNDLLKKLLKFGPVFWGAKAFVLERYKNDHITKVSYLYAIDLIRSIYSNKKKVVMVNIFTPTEIFYALDLYPLLPEVASGFLGAMGLIRRPLQESEEVVSAADVCSVHRGIIGLAKLDIFPNPDYLVSYIKPCHSPLYSFNIISRLEGGEFFVLDSYDKVDFLAKNLEELFYYMAKKLNIKDANNRLKRTIHLSNEAYKYFEEVKELRKDHTVIDGKDFLDFAAMIFSSFGSKHGVLFFKTLRDEIKKRIKEGKELNPKIRLYWMHLGPYFKTDFFLWMREKGAYIVFEESTSISWEILDEKNPFESLAKKMLNLKAFSTLEERFKLGVENVNKYKANGIIIFNQWGCRQGSVPSYLLRRKFMEEGIPTIVIDGDLIDETNFPKEQIKTRLEAFFEVIA